ncbi:MAG: AsnC family protein [Candidatus Bathyarchaeota archaeon BA1]|nr:MAG: AsnC family protein [Candidatus Bathyarchaeota archaeon BA1]
MIQLLFWLKPFVKVSGRTGEHLNFVKSAKEEMEKIKGVVKVYGVFERYDLVAEVEAQSLEQLSRVISDELRAIAGVLSTESLIIGF